MIFSDVKVQLILFKWSTVHRSFFKIIIIIIITITIIIITIIVFYAFLLFLFF